MQAAISEADLRGLVEDFYGRVRRDGVLGPIFEAAVHDWPAHLDRLTAFWSSVMLGSGGYKGNPFAAHQRQGDRLSPELFDRWLGIWRETVHARFPAEIAAIFEMKADRIAESLKAGLFFRPAIARGYAAAS
ncbi:MAG TPA: group III truncated hemoglobin [Aurantimonas sp.]|nr:group III truncated hemoglobin [Aurantimonas sp.]